MGKRILLSSFAAAFLVTVLVAGIAVFGGPWHWAKPWAEGQEKDFPDLVTEQGAISTVLQVAGEPSLKSQRSSVPGPFRMIFFGEGNWLLSFRVYVESNSGAAQLVLKEVAETGTSGQLALLRASTTEIEPAQFDTITRYFRSLGLCSVGAAGTRPSATQDYPAYLEAMDQRKYCWALRPVSPDNAQGALKTLLYSLAGYEVE